MGGVCENVTFCSLRILSFTGAQRYRRVISGTLLGPARSCAAETCNTFTQPQRHEEGFRETHVNVHWGMGWDIVRGPTPADGTR